MKSNHLGNFAFVLMGLVSMGRAEQPDFQFAAWDDVPGIIDSIRGDHHREPLRQLHELTRIKLGGSQHSQGLDDEEHANYMLATKRRWERWWETTGKPIMDEKRRDSAVDAEAFRMAWNFLHGGAELPDEIPPVWIPKTWGLHVTFTNGDYMGREKEVWIIDRQEAEARLMLLRGDHRGGPWAVRLKEWRDFKVGHADHVLKALFYLHGFAPKNGEAVRDDEMKGLYYPGTTIHLRDGADRILWNTDGHDFRKSRSGYDEGGAGRSYYFLRSIFADDGKWDVLENSSSGELALLRKFLSLCRPYFSSNASEVIQLFGSHGGEPELRAMLEWAEKEKQATDPGMGWEPRAGDFSTAMKVNLINFTRQSLVETLEQIGKVEARMERAQDGALEGHKEAIGDLERHVAGMLKMKEQEEHEKVEAYPEPLRDLIKADEIDDPDLKHLSAAVQSIRDKPDPVLFFQLAREMHEGTLRIRMLLNHILFNEHGLLELKPWGAGQEAVAVNACIDALPLAKDRAWEDLVASILRMCGGGVIEVESTNGSRRIEVVLMENGHQLKLGGAKNPLPLAEAQEKLRRMYVESRKK